MKLKTINIEGKEYVLVSDRVLFFNEQYKNGCIHTELVSDLDSMMVIVKATVIPDVDKPERYFTDYSQATWGDGDINKTSALENACTSAVGRALGMMGIGIVDSIASADEVNKAINDVRSFPPSKTVDNTTDYLKTVTGANNGQICKSCGVVVTNKVAEYSKSRWGKIYCMDCQSNTTNEDRTE